MLDTRTDQISDVNWGEEGEVTLSTSVSDFYSLWKSCCWLG